MLRNAQFPNQQLLPSRITIYTSRAEMAGHTEHTDAALSIIYQPKVGDHSIE